MITEKFQIDIDVNSADAKQEIGSVKKELQGLSGAGGSVSTSVDATTASMEEMAATMKIIAALDFAQLLEQQTGAFSKFGESITKAINNKLKPSLELLTTLPVNFSPKIWDVLEGNFFNKLGTCFSLLKNDIEEVISGFLDFGKTGVKSFQEMGKEISNVKKGMIALSMVMVPVLGVMASFNASQLGKEIYNGAQRVGMGTAKYQEWVYILEQAGADVTDLIGAQQTLTEAQIDVAEGAEDIIYAFEQIGLSADAVLGMSREELFEATIAGLQNIENASDRAAIGYRLLSEDASTLSAVLSMSNQETAQLASNYAMLGSIMSKNLLQQSLRLQGSLANLRAAWQGLTNTLAEVFLPVVIAVVQWVAKAVAVINMFLRALFNLELTTSESGTGSVVDSGITGFGAMTDAIEETETAAQKLRRTLMGFDELNVVDNPNSGSSASADIGTGAGGIGGISGGVGGFGESLFDTESLGLSKFRDMIEEYKTLIQVLVPIAMIGFGAVGAVLCALSGNWLGALACLALVGTGFAIGSIEGGAWDTLRKTFEKLNMDLIPLAMIGIGTVGAVWCALKGNWVGAALFAAMAGIGVAVAMSGDGFGPLIDDLKQKLSGMKVWIVPATALVMAVAAALMGNFPVATAFLALAGVTGINAIQGGTFFDDAVKAIKEVWNSLKSWFNSNVKPIFTKQWWSNLFAKVGEGASTKLGEVRTTIMNVWNNVKDYFNTNIKPKFTLAYWQQVFGNISKGASTKLGEVRTTIINAWNNIKSYFSTNIAPKFTVSYWLTKFNTIKDGVSTALGAVRTTVMNVWNNIKSYFLTNIAPKFTVSYWSNKFEPIRSAANTKLNAVRTTVMNAWNNIKSYFNTNIKPKFTVKYWTTQFNTIKDGAKAAFNGVISVVESAVNGIIKKINTVSWEIPDWVPGFGGDKFGFNMRTIKIPRLATGGIVNNSTIANIGENGREAVLPLDNNTEWMDALADKIAAKSQGPTKLVLKVGEKELGWASIKGINQITKQTGELQLVL